MNDSQEIITPSINCHDDRSRSRVFYPFIVRLLMRLFSYFSSPVAAAAADDK